MPKKILYFWKIIVESLSVLGTCHMTIMGGVVDKKFMILRFFVYSQSFDNSKRNLFGRKNLSSSCCRHQTFVYKCSNSENDIQSPNFGHFLTIFDIF